MHFYISHYGRSIDCASHQYTYNTHAGSYPLAGVTGSSFIVLAVTLSAMGEVLVAGLAILVAKWTGELDHRQLTSVLNRDNWIEAQEPELILDQKQDKMR